MQSHTSLAKGIKVHAGKAVSSIKNHCDDFNTSFKSKLWSIKITLIQKALNQERKQCTHAFLLSYMDFVCNIWRADEAQAKLATLKGRQEIRQQRRRSRQQRRTHGKTCASCDIWRKGRSGEEGCCNCPLKKLAPVFYLVVWNTFSPLLL